MAYDWDEIEICWKAGVMSVSHICAKHGVSEQRLRKIAKDRSWVRAERGSVVVPIAMFPHDLEDIERVYEQGGAGKVAAEFGLPLENVVVMAQDASWEGPETEVIGPPAEGARWVSVFDADDVKKAGLLASASVLSSHRQDITKLRGLAKRMIDGMEALMTGGEPPEFPVLGPKESVADVLGKIAIISGKVIELERQAYGLNVETQDQKEVDAYAKMDPADRRKKIDELLARTQKARA